MSLKAKMGEYAILANYEHRIAELENSRQRAAALQHALVELCETLATPGYEPRMAKELQTAYFKRLAAICARQKADAEDNAKRREAIWAGAGDGGAA
jgi:hypothetical protein